MLAEATVSPAIEDRSLRSLNSSGFSLAVTGNVVLGLLTPNLGFATGFPFAAASPKDHGLASGFFDGETDRDLAFGLGLAGGRAGARFGEVGREA